MVRAVKVNSRFTKHFAVGKYLGGGADGRVHSIKSKRSGRVYAAKFIVPRTKGRRPHEAHINTLLMRDPKFQLQRSIVEFGVCFEAKGPGKPAVLVFEFCEMGTLEDYITSKYGRRFRAKTPVPFELVQRFFVELLSALKFLHEPRRHAGRGPIVHRDIKPGNVVVTGSPFGSPLPHVKLCDFGGALERESTNVGGRQPQRPGGSLAAFSRGFAPPELGWPPNQIGYDMADPAFDVYSLGATIFWMIRRIPPPANTKRVAPRGQAPTQHYCKAFWKILRGSLERTCRGRWSVRKLLKELKRTVGSRLTVVN